MRYKGWSSSEGMYCTISEILQFKIRHKSFRVLVDTSLLCFKRCKVLLGTCSLLARVYQLFPVRSTVAQNGL